MSVRQEKPPTQAMTQLDLSQGVDGTGDHLGEGNSFAVAAPDHPLKRVVAVSIKASLNEPCLQKARGTWAPSQEALRNIFQQVSRAPRLQPPACSPVSPVSPVMDESTDDGDVFTPMLIAALRGVIAVQVCCGDNFTVLLDAQGSVFTWGGNDDGCLGLGDDDSRPSPCWVEALKAEFVAGISAGVQHVLARSEEDVWAWGGGGAAARSGLPA